MDATISAEVNKKHELSIEADSSKELEDVGLEESPVQLQEVKQYLEGRSDIQVSELEIYIKGTFNTLRSNLEKEHDKIRESFRGHSLMLERKIADFKSMLQTKEEDIAQLTKDNDNLQECFANVMYSAKKMRKALAKERGVDSDEIKDEFLRNEDGDCINKYGELINCYNQPLNDCDAIVVKKNKELQDTIEWLEERINELQNKLEKKELSSDTQKYVLDQIKQEKKNLEGDNSRLNKEIKILRDYNKRLKKEFKESETKVFVAELSRDKLKFENEELLKSKAELRDSINRLQRRVELYQTLEVTDDKINEVESMETNDEKSMLRKKNAELKLKINKVILDNNEKDSEIKRLEGDLLCAGEKIVELTVSYDTVNKFITNLQAVRAEESGELDKLKHEMKEKDAKIAELENEIDILRSKPQEDIGAKNSLKTQSNIQKILPDNKQDLLKHSNDIQLEISRLQSDMTAVHEKIAAIKKNEREANDTKLVNVSDDQVDGGKSNTALNGVEDAYSTLDSEKLKRCTSLLEIYKEFRGIPDN